MYRDLCITCHLYSCLTCSMSSQNDRSALKTLLALRACTLSLANAVRRCCAAVPTTATPPPCAHRQEDLANGAVTTTIRIPAPPSSARHQPNRPSPAVPPPRCSECCRRVLRGRVMGFVCRRPRARLCCRALPCRRSRTYLLEREDRELSMVAQQKT